MRDKIILDDLNDRTKADISKIKSLFLFTTSDMPKVENASDQRRICKNIIGAE